MALVDGLMQSSVDCWLPTCTVIQNMKEFKQHVDTMFHPNLARVLVHPPKSLQLEIPQQTNHGERRRYNEMRQQENDDIIQLHPVHSHTHQNAQFYSFSELLPLLSQTSLNSIPISDSKIVVAIGPDGGWSDDEADFFVSNHFHLLSLGDRILRTDIAVTGVLTLFHQWFESTKL
jgi:16S rRNA U1498 N3-methylase RsmE